MDSVEAKVSQNPPLKTQKIALGVQIFSRIFAVVTTMAATCIIFTSKQSTEIFSITFDARYSYFSTFKFFAFANAVACAFSMLSLFSVFIPCRPGTNSANYFYYLFFHDLFMMSLVLAGCAAATAEGYVGRYGNSHSGWPPICDHFAKFCNKITSAVMLSYLALLFLLMLTILSATKS